VAKRIFKNNPPPPFQVLLRALYELLLTYVKHENGPKEWEVTAQEGVEPYKDESNISSFVNRLRHPYELVDGRGRMHCPWLDNLSSLIKPVGEDWSIDVELFEVPNSR